MGCKALWLLRRSQPERSAVELLWAFATLGCDDALAIHSALVEAISCSDALELSWCMSQLGASSKLQRSLNEEILSNLKGYDLQRLVLAAVALPREVSFLDPLQEVVAAKVSTVEHLDANREAKILLDMPCFRMP